MAQLLLKLLVCPLILWLVDIFSQDVNYQAAYQPIMAGVFLAVIDRIMEYFLLNQVLFRLSVWINNGADFLMAILVVYTSQFLFPGSGVTFFGAFVAALILTITEHMQHVIFAKRAPRTN